MRKQLLVALFSLTLAQAQDQSTADSDQNDARILLKHNNQLAEELQ